MNVKKNTVKNTVKNTAKNTIVKIGKFEIEARGTVWIMTDIKTGIEKEFSTLLNAVGVARKINNVSATFIERKQ